MLALGVALVPLLASPASAQPISQTPPTSGTTTTTASATFTDQLGLSGGDGTASFVPDTSIPPGFSVDSTGFLTTTGTLAAGTYSITDGSLTDGNPVDDGTYTYQLTVTAVPITQSSPTSVTTTTGLGFTDTIGTTGGIGTVTFVTTAPSSPAGVNVDSSGAVTTTGALAANTYTVSGTDSDIYGDTGTWSYSLVVTPSIIQGAPMANSVTTTSSANFTDQLTYTGNVGPVSFTTLSSEPAGLDVSTAGAVSPSGPLVAGTYVVSGTDTDTNGDVGTWTYTLTVNAAAITQISPSSGTAPTASSASFDAQLETLGSLGAVSFTTTSPSSAVSVSSSGAVTVTGNPAAGSYTVSGTDTDGFGDLGIWSYTLVLTASTISQNAPKSNSVAPTSSAKFTEKLSTSGGVAPVSFVTVATTKPSGATGGLKVSSSGEVSTTGLLTAGTYSASGTDSDALGDAGKWSFTLTVTKSAITQAGPFSNTQVVTVASSSSFTDQLKTTDTAGKVTFTTKGPGSTPPGFVVSSSGVVSTKAVLPVGNYTATGTDSDTLGDAGTWSFSLTVAPTRIVQVSPESGITAKGKAFAGQLKVSGSYGAVTFTQSTGKPSLTVSSAGVVSASGNLSGGIYKATGTATDRFGDIRGTWTFSLTVSGGKLAQLTPTTAQIAAGKGFTTQLKVSGSRGSVIFTQVTGAPELKVSSSGSLTAQSGLAKGIYTASGTDNDSSGDSGNWSFTLTVTSGVTKPTILKQVGADSAATQVGRAYVGHLDVSGLRGTGTYSQSSGAPALRVSPSGQISAPDTLAAGMYKASGSVTDTSGDSGTWSFALRVTANKLAQLAPSAAVIATGRTYSSRLRLSGAHGAVTFSQSRGAPHVICSSSGSLSAPATLVAGIYTAYGSAKDSLGDTGSWSFVLRVDATRILQAVPVAGKVSVGKAFVTKLAVSGFHGTVTFTESKGAPHLTVTSQGRLSAPADLFPGSYSATGGVRDSLGDSGAWGFTLRVIGQTLTQAGPVTAKHPTGTAFKGHLKVSGTHGRITYSQSSGAPRLKVSSTGVISALANLAPGTYKATGTMRDATGGLGKWTFTLVVIKAPKVHKLVQIAPLKGTTPSGKTFKGLLKVSGAQGKVTFTQVTGAEVMTVSPTGEITAPSTLAAATYVVQGTVKDAAGDTGTWTFTLVVTAGVG